MGLWGPHRQKPAGQTTQGKWRTAIGSERLQGHLHDWEMMRVGPRTSSSQVGSSSRSPCHGA
jgi:hypothetical protein